jgi:hypothetical protein
MLAKSPLVSLVPTLIEFLTYDFSNIGGYDFMGPVRNQGACGSCYTVSFV